MTNFPGPIYAERATPVELDALVAAFGGIKVFAEQVRDELSNSFPIGDPDADLVTAATMAHCLGDETRWAGLRDEVTSRHPVAINLRIRLIARPDAVPEPDPDIVDLLREQPGFAIAGRIVTVFGVPIPAGEEQTAYYVVLRYRPLYGPLADPARLYKGDPAYDAKHATDDLQASVLLVSTAIHRDNLIKLQRTATALFVAIWLRQIDVIDRLLETTPTAALPPPYLRSRHTDPRPCLLITCDVAMEWERVFELQTALRVELGVVRASVKAALASTTSMTGICAIGDATAQHIAGSVAHARVQHPTMNKTHVEGSPDVVFAKVADAFESANSALHRPGRGRITTVALGKPVRFFIGLEPRMLAPVAIIQMRETVAQHENEFWNGHRGKGIDAGGNFATRLMSLAVVVTSNIDILTARAMSGDNGRAPEHWWLKNRLAPLIRNPTLEDRLVTEKKLREEREGVRHPSSTIVPTRTEAPGDRDLLKNAYANARSLANKCSRPIGEPGWTQGFRQDAWRQPFAEADFLRNCTRYIRYKKELVPKEQAWRALLDQHGRAGHGVEALATIKTGLGQQHLLERMQDFYRNQFDRVQVAELVRGHDPTEACMLREALIREAAPMLAALSPITDDQHLWERFWIDLNSDLVKIAVHGAMNI